MSFIISKILLKSLKKLIKQAVILAGGRGKRLMPLTAKYPKPMVLINGKPFIKIIIEYLSKQGIDEFLILTGYKSKIIENYFKDDTSVKILKGDLNYETGMRLMMAWKKNLLKKNFFLLYCDNFCKINYKLLLKKYYSFKKSILMTVYNNKNGLGEYGKKNNIVYDQKSHLIKKYNTIFQLKPENSIDIGIFIIDKKIFRSFKENKNLSFQKNILTKYINENQVVGYNTNQSYFYITSKESLNNFKKFYKINYK